MATIKTLKGQTLRDLAMQLYANVDAVAELMQLNDLAGNMEQGDTPADEVDLSAPIVPGTTITYDENSTLINKKELNILKASVRNEPGQTKTLIIATGETLD